MSGHFLLIFLDYRMEKVFILLVVVCFTMCKQKSQTDGTIFVDMDYPEKVSLSDYFSSIELIPLETSPDVLIAGITKIIICQDRYYMLDPAHKEIFEELLQAEMELNPILIKYRFK
jgi:hypothetical protein